MNARSLALVFMRTFITFGIYALIWLVSTKNELNNKGVSISIVWFLFVSFVNILWLWKYSAGVGVATNKRVIDIDAFLLLLALGPIGMAVLQSKYNDAK